MHRCPRTPVAEATLPATESKLSVFSHIVSGLPTTHLSPAPSSGRARQVRGPGSGHKRTGSALQVLLAVQLQASYFLSLFLSFLTCKMGVTMYLTSQVYSENEMI